MEINDALGVQTGLLYIETSLTRLPRPYYDMAYYAYNDFIETLLQLQLPTDDRCPMSWMDKATIYETWSNTVMQHIAYIETLDYAFYVGSIHIWKRIASQIESAYYLRDIHLNLQSYIPDTISAKYMNKVTFSNSFSNN